MNYLYQWGDCCQVDNMEDNEKSIYKLLKQNTSVLNLNELPMGKTVIKIHLIDLNH